MIDMCKNNKRLKWICIYFCLYRAKYQFKSIINFICKGLGCEFKADRLLYCHQTAGALHREEVIVEKVSSLSNEILTLSTLYPIVPSISRTRV